MVHEPAEGAFDDPAAGLERESRTATIRPHSPHWRDPTAGPCCSARSDAAPSGLATSGAAGTRTTRTSPRNSSPSDITASTSSRSTTAGSSRWGTGSRTTSFLRHAGVGRPDQRCRAACRPLDRPVNGIIYRVSTGCRWRELPARFGPWQTIHKRHMLWSADGTWETLLQHVQAVADSKGDIDWDINIDSTSVRAHLQAAGAPTALQPTLSATSRGRGKISSPARALASAAVLGGGARRPRLSVARAAAG
ncbi:transposase [Streptomyces thinghirensis]|nr:transposase [Streptomyces thinghirensis]